MRASGVFGSVPTRRDIADFSRPVGTACPTGAERLQGPTVSAFTVQNGTFRDWDWHPNRHFPRKRANSFGTSPVLSSILPRRSKRHHLCSVLSPCPTDTAILLPPSFQALAVLDFQTGDIFPAIPDSFAFSQVNCYNAAPQPANLAPCAFVPSDVRQDANATYLCIQFLSSSFQSSSQRPPLQPTP